MTQLDRHIESLVVESRKRSLSAFDRDLIKLRDDHKALLEACKLAERVLRSVKTIETGQTGKWYAAQRQLQAAIAKAEDK